MVPVRKVEHALASILMVLVASGGTSKIH